MLTLLEERIPSLESIERNPREALMHFLNLPVLTQGEFREKIKVVTNSTLDDQLFSRFCGLYIVYTQSMAELKAHMEEKNTALSLKYTSWKNNLQARYDRLDKEKEKLGI